ncbi:MAG: ROK family protein [Bacteroidota bacterium]
MKEVVIGIDIGGTYTKYGIVDRNGVALAESYTSTDQFNDINSYLDNLQAEIENTMTDISEEIDIKGIGIGAPNGNYYHGTIEQAPNLKWKGIVPFVELFKKYYNLPMVLTNDANAAALGEMIYGGAKEMKNFVVITLGTGLGSGLVVNGELVYGHDGFAGELGHVTIIPGGRMCSTGRRGSLETYVSANGIKRTVFALLADSIEDSEFRDITFNQLTSAMISDAAKRGDKIALEAFDYTAKILGRALSDTVEHLSPEAIFLFGGLAKAGDLIFEPTKKYLEENLLPIFRNKVKLIPSQIHEANAAVLGASALAWKELEK